MAEVVDLDAQRPHVTVFDLEGNVHVVPCLYFERLLDGRQPLEVDDETRPLLLGVIAAWYEGILAEDWDT